MNTKMKTAAPPSKEENKEPEPEGGDTTKHEEDTETNCSTELKSTKSGPSEEAKEEKLETKITPESSSENEESTDKKDCEENNKEAEEDQTDESAKDGDSEENPEAEALALSASLSSSKCLLKRNREDLDTDSDNDDKEEEPDSKKSHQAKDEDEEEKEGKEGIKKETKDEDISPIVVSKSKLSSSELVASMSSSKSVLKRGFEQMDETNCKEPEVKVKKSLITEASPVKEGPDSIKIVEELENCSDNLKSPRAARDRLVFNVKSPVIPLSPLKSELPLLESTRLNSPESKPCTEESSKPTPNKSLQSPKEPVRVIAAKDLEEDRKLERKRLNKMLLIFSDQKPV